MTDAIHQILSEVFTDGEPNLESKMGILENKTARESAELTIEFMEEIEANLPTCVRHRFLKNIRDELIERCPLPESDGQKFERMSDNEARMFGQQPMPFGKHEGEPIDNICLSYFSYLVINDKFIKQLNRYLASPRVQLEQ